MKLVIICALLQLVSILVSEVNGATYTRWGRTQCSDGATPLMKGYMAGTARTHAGNGGNYLCLSDTPQRGKVVAGRQPATGYVYGAAYVFNQGYGKDAPFSFSNNEDQDPSFYAAPCVQCYRSDRTTTEMFAGRLTCPNEAMQLEYQGYVISAYQDNQGTQYVCLDDAPEVVFNSKYTSGIYGDFYPVQVPCGFQIPCPPYVDGDELACAVCSI